jgi:hypothetical protein
MIFQTIGLLSLGKIATNRGDIVYVIEKPEEKSWIVDRLLF